MRFNQVILIERSSDNLMQILFANNFRDADRQRRKARNLEQLICARLRRENKRMMRGRLRRRKWLFFIKLINCYTNFVLSLGMLTFDEGNRTADSEVNFSFSLVSADVVKVNVIKFYYNPFSPFPTMAEVKIK